MFRGFQGFQLHVTEDLVSCVHESMVFTFNHFVKKLAKTHVRSKFHVYMKCFMLIKSIFFLEAIGPPSIVRVIRNAADLVRMLTTFDLICEEITVRR